MKEFDADYFEDDEMETSEDMSQYVIARRFNGWEHYLVKIKNIRRVEWTDMKFLNGSYQKLPYYIIKGNIDYDLASSLRMASGTHSSRNNGANIFIYKCDNEGETKEGYKRLMKIAGEKPIKRRRKE